MPRVANPPRANGRSNPKAAAAGSPQKSPLKMPLNDDRQEKMVRLQSRQALHDIQMNEIRAAASPMRKLNSFQRAGSTSPKGPGASSTRRKDPVEEGLGGVGGPGMTPMKRVPILANFEEWMKMATDNKINATNSWNFALIDYFHDMSLLKEGDGVNFQKASCTLDGCVKIYTSRVDSVATETGKLLSGLAESGNKKRHGDGEDGEEGEDDEEEEEGEDGVKRRTKKKTQRSSEATLAPSFASLQLKKFELEFSIDPLSKKAAADFDEGGVKGLLLNHLSIDGQGRIVFDSSDDTGDANGEQLSPSRSGSQEPEDPEDVEKPTDVEDEEDIEIASLGQKFFPDLDRLEEQDICPSLKNYELGDQSGSLDIPFLKAPEDWRQERTPSADVGNKSGIFLDDDNAPGFDDDDGILGGLDLPADTGFGEGGEAWAKDAALEPQMRPHDAAFDNDVDMDGEQSGEIGPGGFDAETESYAVRLDHGSREDRNHEDILSYFDQALKKNWAGPEHWRIRRVKDIGKSPTASSTKRKEKEPFEIDFASPLDPLLAELIYTPATSKAAISLPKAQWRSKTRNLLPDDKHFNSKQLLRLFLKPKARMGSSKRRIGLGNARPVTGEDVPEGEMDEAFWARKENPQEAEAVDGQQQGDYDANFFQDDGLGMPGGLPDDDDDEFADAREEFSPELGEVNGSADGADAMGGIADVLAAGAGDSQEGAFGTQLVTQSRRLRPEYVEYARVAKKVDVRRLKEEMWKGIGLEEPEETTDQPLQTPPASKAEEGTLKFTTVMNNLQSVYPKQAMADISTSYCFICLLHLANEKGLVLGNEEGLEELIIRKDPTAEIVDPI